MIPMDGKALGWWRPALPGAAAPLACGGCRTNFLAIWRRMLHLLPVAVASPVQRVRGEHGDRASLLIGQCGERRSGFGEFRPKCIRELGDNGVAAASGFHPLRQARG